MDYREPRPIDLTAAEEILAGDDTNRICETLVALAYHEPDADRVQHICMRLAEQHQAVAVRQLAATWLGHLARIHRSKSILAAKPLLERLLDEPDVAGCASDALDDVQMFIK